MNFYLALLTALSIVQTVMLGVVVLHVRELRLAMGAILANLIRVRNKVAPMTREEEQMMALEVYGDG